MKYIHPLQSDPENGKTATPGNGRVTARDESFDSHPASRGEADDNRGSGRNALNTSAPGFHFRRRKSLSRIQTNLSRTPVPPTLAATRAYFRSMRAAEMAAWELTGGDFVRSCFVE
jgi:hypothetical protein